MSPSTAIPAAPATCTNPSAPAADAMAASQADEASLAPSTGLTGLTGLVAARLAAKAGVPRAEPAVMPRLAPGKPVPGSAAWRALERHAASFRLR